MMKKALLALGIALAAQPSLAGQAVIYPTPAPAPCPEPCPYSVEIGGKYGFANSDLFRGGSSSADTYGGDLTVVYHFNPCHSINLRGGYTYGHASDRFFDAHHKTNLHTFYLMPGYRYTHSLGGNWSFFIGGNAGAANLSVKDKLNTSIFRIGDHASEYGFAYSGEAGLRYRICEASELFVAYEFFGSTASPSVSEGSMHKQTYNVVRAGMSFKF